jgi:hypothetical protein
MYPPMNGNTFATTPRAAASEECITDDVVHSDIRESLVVKYRRSWHIRNGCLVKSIVYTRHSFQVNIVQHCRSFGHEELSQQKIPNGATKVSHVIWRFRTNSCKSFAKSLSRTPYRERDCRISDILANYRWQLHSIKFRRAVRVIYSLFWSNVFRWIVPTVCLEPGQTFQ